MIFGPNYSKFKEAHDLIDLKAGFSIIDEADLKEITDRLVNDEALYKNACIKSKDYVKDHTGATKTIIDHLNSIQLELQSASGK